MYYGNPVAHNLGLMTHALPFARALRTKNVYSASSADQLPQMLAAFRMFGHLALIPVPDLDRTDYFLDLRREPGRVERQPHDRPGHEGPSPRHSRSRRARRRRRSAAHRDGGDRRRACRHPARDRRAAARGDAARGLRRGMGAPGPLRRPGQERRCARRPSCASSRRSASLAGRASAPDDHASARARLRARDEGGVLRPGRALHAAARHARGVARAGAQSRHRTSRRGRAA